MSRDPRSLRKRGRLLAASALWAAHLACQIHYIAADLPVRVDIARPDLLYLVLSQGLTPGLRAFHCQFWPGTFPGHSDWSNGAFHLTVCLLVLADLLRQGEAARKSEN